MHTPMIQKLLFSVRKLTPTWVSNVYHFCLAFLGHAIYGFPSRKLLVVGVTGTNGKTTTSLALAHILHNAGFKVAALTSAQFKFGERLESNPWMNSMPGRFKIAKLLSRAVRSGCEVVVVESTSEGVLQYRHRFIEYDYFVVTNLRHEHIERHGSFENYKQAKLELVRRLVKTKRKDVSKYRNIEISKGIAVNLDDEYAKEFLDVAGVVRKIGITFQNATTQPHNHTTSVLECRWEGDTIIHCGIRYRSQVPGFFNAYNVVLAASAATFFGVSFEQSLELSADFGGVPGRFEVIQRGNVVAIVDYAHEPFSLEQVLKLAKERYSGLLVHVFGATGGGRDVWKRPVMGEVSGRYADKIILTNDDPYDEDQEVIANQIRAGIRDHSKVELLLDRTAAVDKAIRDAHEHGGVVVVTGKGTENLMCFENGRKIPWNDRAVIEAALDRHVN